MKDDNLKNETNKLNEAVVEKEEKLDITPTTPKEEWSQEETLIEKSHKGRNILITILLLLLLIGGGGAYYYFKVYNNPMMVIGKILNSARKELHVDLNSKLASAYKVNAVLDFDVTFKDQQEQKIADIINDIKIQYIQSYDKNLNSVIELNSKYQNDKLLNIKGVLKPQENNNYDTYFYLDGLYDKYLKTTVKGKDEWKIDTSYDQNIIVDGIFNALQKSLTDDDFTRIKDEIKINGQKIKVNKNTLEINRDNYKRIMGTFFKTLKNDQAFIREMKKLINDIATKIDEMINKVEQNEHDKVMDIVFYTKCNLTQELVQISLIQNGDSEQLVFTKTGDDEYVMELISKGQVLATSTIKETSDNTYVIDCSIQNENKDNLKFSLTFSYDEIDKVEIPDVSNYIDSEKLTEDDSAKISMNLMNNPALIKLINNITSLYANDL